MNAKAFQTYILYEKHWILFEKHDDLIYNEHEVVDTFADKIFKSLDFLLQLIKKLIFNIIRNIMWASTINFFRANILISILNSWILYYILNRIFTIFNLNTHKLILLIIAIILWFVIISTIMYQWDNKIIDIIWTFSSWIFVLSFLFAIVLVLEQIIWKRYKINPRIILWVVVIILWIWVFYSLKTKIISYDITTNKIEKDTKILLVSDFHTDNIYKEFHVKKLEKFIELEKPDIVLIAWDMMNKANPEYPKYFSILENINTPIFAVMWNHDMLWNHKVIKEIPKNSWITLLNNETAELNWIQIIWLTDKSIRWETILAENLEECNIKSNNEFTILITHQPISLKKLKDYPIDLEVAGHTHHGQIFWLRKLTEIVNDYWYWKFEENWKTAIVTQGIWTRWLPFRLGTQSEIVIIKLKTKNN